MTDKWVADLENGMYQNPILYTDYSDPDAIRVGDDYFMIASSFCNAPAIPLLHSKDLVNWKVVNYVLEQIPGERYREPMHGCGVWAPSIRYHEGTYYVCFPMPDEGIFMCTAKDPFGTWSKPINIRPGAGWIDPCPFWDEDGNAYLVAGVAKSRIGYKSVLHLVRMKPDGTKVFGDEVRIFDGNLNDQVTIEGPKMHKKDGYYYIFAPAGGVKQGWQTVLRSKNIWGPYEYKVVMRQGDTDINGPHQGAWVDTQTKEDWFLHFQDVYAAGRITHLQPMHWENGWPIIGVKKDGNEYGEPVRTYRKPNVGGNHPIVACATSDEFNLDKLGLQWQWNANWKHEWYELLPEKSMLKLNAQPKKKETAMVNLPNLLLQKWPANQFSCVSMLSLTTLCDGDVAGLVSMGVTFGALLIKKQPEGYKLYQKSEQQIFGAKGYQVEQEETYVCDWLQDDIYLKYDVSLVGYEDQIETKNAPIEEICFSYSTDGIEYTTVFSIRATAGRWVGVKNGFCCYHDGSGESSGSVLIDYVRYKLT